MSAIFKPTETGDYDYLPVRSPHSVVVLGSSIGAIPGTNSTP